MARTRRETVEYLSSAIELSALLPQFKKFKKRKRLEPWEKSWIARNENIYRYTKDLRPVSKREAKQFKELLYSPITTVKKGSRKGQERHHAPISAVQMANVGDDFKLLGRVGRNLYIIRSNGRTWVYQRLDDTDTRAMRDAGEDAFTDPYTYEIEKVIKLAEEAFKRPETKAVYLWAEQGRVGAPQPSLQQFARWIADDYSRYENTDRWVKGIAILIGDVGERITLQQYRDFSPRRAPKERDYSKRKRKKRKQKGQRR
jgi:hypothetical protein